MSQLVNDFLINPVLRQARRLSRSNPRPDPVEPSSHPASTQRNHEGAVADITERLGSLNGHQDGGAGESRAATTISDAELTTSPIEEDAGPEDVRPSHAPTGYFHAVPLRVGSLRSEFGQVDDTMSDNPSFGIPGRFRTNSSVGTTFGNVEYNVANGGMSPVEGPVRRSTLDVARSGQPNAHVEGVLAEDDGMGHLRQHIRSIQSMDITSDQKARLMHELLTKDYVQAHQLSHTQHQPTIPDSPATISQERPVTPSSLSSFLWQMNGSPEAPAKEQQHTYQLSAEDLKRTYAPPDPLEADEDGDIGIQDELPALGCCHYKRNVKLQCSACDKWYTCRLCHDAVEDHVLNRKETKNMLCMICGCAQRASETCVECGERTAWYYCAVCKLWDNDANKSIYHCNDCGICRKGRGIGKDFFHCKTCGTCMSMSVEHSHKCIERVSDCDCPICGEYMFTSPSRVVFMLCGHGIHKACYDQHMVSSYKCPICSKSTVNMETQFRNLDRAIESQPMPPEFQDTVAMVSCNDCYAKSAVKYHWLGLKCAICDSYNTAQLSILSDPAAGTPIETEDVPTPNLRNVEVAPPFLNGPRLIPARRYSTHLHGLSRADVSSDEFASYPRLQRIGRSVSPVAGLGLSDGAVVALDMETDEIVEEDAMDFWGRDEPRQVVSAIVVDDEMEDSESNEDDDDSVMDDYDDDADDDDQFELFGHR